MEVILQQNFPALGYVGDTVKVRGGYARNFLIPRGIALEASSTNEKLLKHQLGGVNARKRKLRSEAEELQKKLEGVTLEFSLRIGGSGKAFGSITARDVEAGLKNAGFALDKHQIILTEPIRKGGEHTVTLKLHSEVSATVPVKVQTEVPQVEQKAADSEGEKPRKRRGKKAAAEEGSESAPEATETPAAPEEQK